MNCNYGAVFNMSKIQIWKRITTDASLVMSLGGLYLICQRYKFESESQLISNSSHKEKAVFNMSKIQIWKRITTCPGLATKRVMAVFNMSKIQIWKRITTSAANGRKRQLLYLICQRYKFESESQLRLACLIYISAVFNMSKIQIWKRITTDRYYTIEIEGCI